MAGFTVTAPVGDYDGEVGGVRFAGGVAVMDDEKDAAALAYCQAAGYTVAPVEDDSASEKDEAQKPARRARSSKETNA